MSHTLKKYLYIKINYISFLFNQNFVKFFQTKPLFIKFFISLILKQTHLEKSFSAYIKSSVKGIVSFPSDFSNALNFSEVSKQKNLREIIFA